MSPSMLQKLADDILENGLKERIVLTNDGTVLVDGRNRLRACGVAGVEPRFSYLPKDISEAEIVRLITTTNLQTRNFTPGQLAIVGLELSKVIEKVPVADLKHYPLPRSYDNRTPRSFASALVGVSSKTIWQVATIEKFSSDILNRVHTGELRLNTAYEMVMDMRGLRNEPKKIINKPTHLTDTPPRGRDNTRRAVESRRAWLQHLAKQNMSATEISNMLDISDEHVRRLARKYQIELPGDVWSYKRRKRVVDINRVAQVVADDLVAMDDAFPQIQDNADQIDEEKAVEFARIYMRAARQLRQLARALNYDVSPTKRMNDEDGDSA